MKKVKLVIEQQDIDLGICGSVDQCPIARSADRAGIGNSIYVFGDEMWVDGRTIPLPVKAQVFVERFDDGKDVRPFSFLV